MDYTNKLLKEVLSLRYDDLSRQSLKRIKELEQEVEGLIIALNLIAKMTPDRSTKNTAEQAIKRYKQAQ